MKKKKDRSHKKYRPRNLRLFDALPNSLVQSMWTYEFTNFLEALLSGAEVTYINGKPMHYEHVYRRYISAEDILDMLHGAYDIVTIKTGIKLDKSAIERLKHTLMSEFLISDALADRAWKSYIEFKKALNKLNAHDQNTLMGTMQTRFDYLRQQENTHEA